MDISNSNMEVKTMSQLAAEGRKPEYLFWVGCSGSYDPRAQKISVAMVKLLNAAGVDFAILGDEEVCTGDPARRAGNEFLFQMMAHQKLKLSSNKGINEDRGFMPALFHTLKMNTRN
jgi:Fe-S oxidoreductase